MNVDAADASRALDDIASASGRTSQMQNYREAAPHFIMWGLAWLIGNGALHFLPAETAGWIMMAAIFAAVLGGAFLGMSQDKAKAGEDPRSLRARKRTSLRIMMMIFVIFGLVIGAVIVFWPVEYMQVNAFISLCAGLAYIGGGLFVGWRMIAAGVVVTAAVLAGYLALEPYYYLWMAVVGGGTLILSGLWLRKA